MDKYYYFGEFGYLNLEILGGLEEYFKKNPKKKIEIATYENYGMLLKYLFPKNVEIKKVEWSGDEIEKGYRKSHAFIRGNKPINLTKTSTAKNLSVLFSNRTKKYFIEKVCPKEDYEQLRIIELNKPLGEETCEKNYISINPRNRAIGKFRNLSEKDWQELIEKIKKDFPNKEIVLHGVGTEKLNLTGKFIYPKSIIEQIKFLNKSVCCICPDSGFAHFSLNCGCDTIVIGESYWPYMDFNPFKNKLILLNKKNVLSIKIKKLLYVNTLNFKTKTYILYKKIKRRAFYWVETYFPSFYKKLIKTYRG